MHAPCVLTSVRSCSEWGLPGREVTFNAGELLPRRFTLTTQQQEHFRTLAHPFGGLFSVALSLTLRPVGVTDHSALWSPDFPLITLPVASLPGVNLTQPNHTGSANSDRLANLKNHHTPYVLDSLSPYPFRKSSLINSPKTISFLSRSISTLKICDRFTYHQRVWGLCDTLKRKLPRPNEVSGEAKCACASVRRANSHDIFYKCHRPTCTIQEIRLQPCRLRQNASNLPYPLGMQKRYHNDPLRGASVQFLWTLARMLLTCPQSRLIRVVWMTLDVEKDRYGSGGTNLSAR